MWMKQKILDPLKFSEKPLIPFGGGGGGRYSLNFLGNFPVPFLRPDL